MVEVLETKTAKLSAHTYFPIGKSLLFEESRTQFVDGLQNHQGGGRCSKHARNTILGNALYIRLYQRKEPKAIVATLS